MSSIHLRRAVAVVTGAMLAAMLIGPATVSAAQPGWEFTNLALLPSAVSPGSSAGYSFTIHNGGSSNISHLYLTDSVNAAPTYFVNSRGTVCQQSPTLFCSFGALNSGDSIDVTVAYATPTSGSAFDVTFQLNSNGATFSDRGGNSHGDSLNSPKLTTALSSNKNFAGAFSLDTTDVATDPSLSKQNPQSSAVTPPVSKIPVTVEDGLVTFGGAGTDPCGTATLAHCIGDWARLNVDNGAAGPVKVTIMLYGKSVPNAATTSNIKLFHEGSSPNPITTQCERDDPAHLGRRRMHHGHQGRQQLQDRRLAQPQRLHPRRLLRARAATSRPASTGGGHADALAQPPGRHDVAFPLVEIQGLSQGRP